MNLKFKHGSSNIKYMFCTLAIGEDHAYQFSIGRSSCIKLAIYIGIPIIAVKRKHDKSI